MTFALLYMDVTNLGDIIIYDNARYLLEKVIKDNGIEDSEILPVDIGGYNFKEMQVPSYVDRMDKVSEKVMELSKKQKLYKRFPNLARRMMLWAWRHSKQYYCFKKTEMPKLEKSDIIIFGGGGLIKYHQQTFHFTIDTVTRFANRKGVPVIINSVGVEGYEEGHPGCMLLKKALNLDCIKYISTRDDFEVLKNNFMTNPRIKVESVCDPAFWTKETYGVEKKEPQEEKRVGLNTIRFGIFRKYMYKVNRNKLDEMYRDLAFRLHDDGYKVEFFTNGVVGDINYINKLMEKYPELEEITSITQPQTPKELVELISGYDRYLAARLHASIVGSVLGVPNVSLVWNIKQILFGEMVGMPQNYLTKEAFNADTVYERLMAAEPYVMNEELKYTVYNGLEQAILENIRHEA